MLIDALLEACDLLAQFLYLVFEIFLPAPHAGVARLENVAQDVHSTGRGAAREADRDVGAAEGRLSDRACGGGGGEGSHGEATDHADGRPDNKLCSSLAQPKTPS